MRQIYGIDLSKKIDVSYIDSQGSSSCKLFLIIIKGINKLLMSLPPNSTLVAEHTGVYGDLLVILANQYNIPISLCSGYNIKHSLGLQKGKTDKVDKLSIT